MTNEERARAESRIEHAWERVPEANAKRVWAALSDQVNRLSEGDRPLQEYIKRAKQLGREEAADVAHALRTSEIYGTASPERMPKLAAQLAPIYRRGRPETWLEEHFKQLDGLDENERAGKIRVIVNGCFPNLPWPAAKGRRDGLLKAYKRDRELSRRQK